MTARDAHIVGGDRVREVFRRVAAGDDGVADLYADDGVVRYAPGKRVDGRDAIRAFYRSTIDAIHPQPSVDSVLVHGSSYLATVTVPTENGPHRAVDLFVLGDDGILELTIFHIP